MPTEMSPVPVRHRVACALTGALLGLTQGFGLYLVSSNLPAIQGSLGATAAEAGWLTTAYFATVLSSSVLLTKVRFQFGLRPFARVGLVAFVIVATLHLLTDSVASAAAARAALGLAAAPLSTLTVLYLIEAFPPRLAAAGLLLGFAALQLPLPLSRVISVELLELGRWHGLFVFEVALSLLCLAALHAVEVTPTPQRQAFGAGDAIAFPLYAGALALLCVVLSQGRLHWWTDAPWLGVCLAAAVACFGAYVAFELRRPQPMLNLRWLAQPYMLRFMAAVLLFRIVLSEQTVGVVGLMSALGQGNEQMRLLFLWISAALFAGFVVAIVLAARVQAPWLAVLAICLVIAAAASDAGVTALTRPGDLLVSQTLLALALAIFFGAACLLGFGPVMQDGGRELITFLAVFTACQYLGSLLGSAWIGTLVADRQRWHYAALAQHLSQGDPAVATRIAQLAGSVGRFVNDPAARVQQGLSLFSQQVTRESLVLAYIDVFQAITALAAAMLVWLGWLAWRARRRRAPAGGAGA